MESAASASTFLSLLTIPLPDASFTNAGATLAVTDGKCSNFREATIASQVAGGSAAVGSFGCTGAFRFGLNQQPLDAMSIGGHFDATFGRSDVSATIGLLGDDADKHGCKSSAGYSWCSALQECVRPWETPCAGAARRIALSHCEARVTLQSLMIDSASVLDGSASSAWLRPALHATLETHINAAACSSLNASTWPAELGARALPTALPTLNAAAGDGQMRLGAELAFGALGILLLATIATLTCFCRQRELEQRTRRTRYTALLRQYANEDWAGVNGALQPGPSGAGLRSAAESLLRDDGLPTAPTPPRGGISREHSRETLRKEVSTLADMQRAAVSNTWWRVVAAWMATASAAVFHALLAGRLGLLSLDASEAESPGTDDMGILLVWAANAPPVTSHADPPSGHSPVLALPLPVGEPLFGGEGIGDLDVSVRSVLYLLAACTVVPLASFLLLLLALPWTPPDLEPPQWLWLRQHALSFIETLGIWSLLPVCVALGFSATLQTTLELPRFPFSEPSSMHIELTLGCSLGLYTGAAILTLGAVNRAAMASKTPPTAPTAATAAGVPATAAQRASTAGGLPLARMVSGSYTSLPPLAAHAVTTVIAAQRESTATITRRRFTFGALLHATALLLVLAALPLPALEIAEPAVVAHGARVPTPIGARQLSLIGAVAGAAGTEVAADAPVLVHGEWQNASSVCGLTRPPPALIVSLALLISLVLPLAWRTIRAFRAARGAADSSWSDFRGGGQRLAAWRLADVITAALLAEIILLPAIGRPLINSQMGDALRRFGGITAVEWSASWGVGAWMLLAATLCDGAGRLVTR